MVPSCMPTDRKKRGVLYVVWGRAKNRKLDDILRRSTQSVFKHHPELHVTVKDLPEGSTLLDKPKMYELSPYEETIYLDIDTEVLARLDFAIRMMERHALALAICEAATARRFTKSITDDLIEYNTGVMFFKRSAENDRLFARWGELAKTMDSSCVFRSPNGTLNTGPCNDQASFSQAIHELGMNPFVLSMNWNYRFRWQPAVHGPVKVWHDYEPIPPELRRYWERQERGEEPMDFARVNVQFG